MLSPFSHKKENTRPQAIQDEDGFVYSWEHIWRIYSITSLAHQWTLCSEWVPSE